MTKQKETPGWMVNNIIPIVLTLLTWAASFGILITKVETIIKNQDQQYTMWLQLEKRVGTLEVSDATNKAFHEEVGRVLELR